MIATSALIDLLVANARPVRRLRPPSVRALLWLLFAMFILALIAVGHGMRPDLALRVRDPFFVVGMGAALSTGVLAAVASFMINVPDRSRGWIVLPMPSLIVWVFTTGYGCLTRWVDIDAEGMHAGDTARCFATLMLTSLPLSLALFAMLRNGSLLRPAIATLTASLAVAAITASAMSLFHDLNATAMILLWNLGTGVAIVAGGACLYAIRSRLPPKLLAEPA